MRISDLSSDVCSSDLGRCHFQLPRGQVFRRRAVRPALRDRPRGPQHHQGRGGRPRRRSERLPGLHPASPPQFVRRATEPGMSDNANGRLVSVVMPLYNAEKFVRRSMESVLAQTHQLLELIVVDDGSTDSSLSVASAIADADARVRLLRNRKSGGEGKRVSVRVDIGGRGSRKKKTQRENQEK